MVKILGKPITGYNKLRVDAQRRVSLFTGHNSSGGAYSEFHFGAGEASVIRMVFALESAEVAVVVGRPLAGGDQTGAPI